MDRDRRAAYLVLKEVLIDGSWSNLALAKQFSEEAPAYPAFVRELVYGVLRNRLLLDYNIDRFLQKPKLKASERILLELGFYQLAFMEVADYAAISESVALAKSFMRGKEGFINAILRSFQRAGKELLVPENKGIITKYSVKYSADPAIVRLWIDAYGEEKAEELLCESCKEAPLSIRVNLLKNSKEELMEQLKALGFEVTASKLCKSAVCVKGSGLLDTRLYKEGFFSVQGEASQYAVELLAPRAGETMLDVCAAPGGKSCAAAELMENRGCIKAYELHEHRVALIEKEAKRLGLGIIEARAADSAVFEFPLADCVLCDVPCSGLGTLRRNPELKLKAPGVPKQAFDILCNAARAAKDRILYSTCTINPAENEGLVASFLAKQPQWRLSLEKQFFPSEGGPDGFYIALLRKN